jgi:hypothetical protein
LNSPRASNPSSSPSLRDKSKVLPGHIDLSIFQKPQGRLSQGVVSKNYLQNCRNDNPDPAPTVPLASIKLSDCIITTPADKIDVGKDFTIECNAEFVNDYTPTNAKVSFSVLAKYANEEDENLETFFGLLDLNARAQKVFVTENLPLPKPNPPKGAKVSYRVVANHPEADSPANSKAVEVILTYPEKSDAGEHITDRKVKVLTADGGTLIGAQFVLCENGKIFHKGKLDSQSEIRYSAKPGCEYSIFFLNAGEIEKAEGL